MGNHFLSLRLSSSDFFGLFKSNYLYYPRGPFAVLNAILSRFSAATLRAHPECLQTLNWSIGLQKKVKLFQEFHTVHNIPLVVAGASLIMATEWNILLGQELCHSHNTGEVLPSFFYSCLIC